MIVIGIALASTMSISVWQHWENWGRALVPVHLATLAALLPPTTFRSDDDAVAADSDAPVGMIAGAARG